MLLQCPNCGRKGNLPDHLAPSEHTVRCRRCRARFSIAPSTKRTGAFPPGPPFKTSGSTKSAQVGGVGRFSSEAFFSADDDDPLADSPGLGDSHYDMPVVFDDDLGDSNAEVPTYRSPGASREEGHPSGTFEPASSEVFLTSPWYDNFIDSWSRYHFFTALGFGTSSLAVLGFLLVRALVAGQIMDSSITALIVGCVGTVAFLLLSVSATALIVLLVDLGRNLRRLIVNSTRDARIAGE
jgi:hypothetical protein